jgi:hypothetical protein
VVAHDRLDLDIDEADQLKAADAVLDGELL